MDALRRLCRRLFHRGYRPYVLARIARPGQARLPGLRLPLRTDAEVFHPGYFSSTRILIDALSTLDLRGLRFLDMGTGSGAVALYAATRGAVVTACDVNPRAAALARQNAALHGATVEVLESNLFASLPDRTFDLVVFNIPFYPRPARTQLEKAFFAGDDFATVRAFAEACPLFVAPGGHVVIIFSEDSGHDRILSFFTNSPGGMTVVDERRVQKFFELFYVVRFARVGF